MQCTSYRPGEHFHAILLAKVDAFERKVTTGELGNDFANEVAIMEEHDRMGKGRIIIEVSLAVRGLAWRQRRFHCEPFAGNIRKALDIVQLSECFIWTPILRVVELGEGWRWRVLLLEQKGRKNGKVDTLLPRHVTCFEKNVTPGSVLGKVCAHSSEIIQTTEWMP